MREDPPPFRVTRISEGLSFGQGSISGAEADTDTLTLLDEAIHSPEILVPVEADDDGCSDGRPAVLVFRKQETFNHSLHRAKVFGGAVTMTAASRIGLGLAGDQQLEEIFEGSIGALEDRKINFGAHTDEDAQDGNCGCGAIDKAPEALTAVLKYEGQIRDVAAGLGADPKRHGQVFDNFRQYVRDNLSQAVPYRGRAVMDRIESAGAVVKKLGGQHRERRIIINRVRGYTVNQQLIQWVTGNNAQVFAIDYWRLEDIAAGVYPGQPNTQAKALLSELVYTLGTSAVLTKGDLPIDMIEPVST